ncbi:MAG TPA: hypothetical protein VK348_12880, partial [Planctomycetota bacterium]|nr:hypothetical protein [Planctomycetota bacterium]
IDSAVKLLTEGNNGLYTNEWLLGDIKTDEIAMFELGTQRTRLWRSSKDEWLGGTKGFYWGCNNERELELRLEQIPSLLDRPHDLTCHPSDRDCKWLALFDQWQGRIDQQFGQLAFTTPPLAAAHSLDAKVTTSALAGRLQSIALFGPPRGSTWMPTSAELQQYPEITPLVHHDWTLLGPVPLPAGSSRAVDLALARPKADKGDDDDDSNDAPAPAWHGSLLPASAADLWLPIAFAAHERMVAEELACAADQRPAERALQQFQLRARWQHALRSLGKDVPLLSLSSDLRRSEWYELALGKGTLLLDKLRSACGDDQYREYMDSFGRAHAGQKVHTSEFVAHIGPAGGKDAAPLLQTFLRGEPSPGAQVWSVTAFELEPEQALIVYGTRKEAPANREAAQLLQRRVASRWHNFDVPIKADVEVTDAELQGHHLVLVGRPCTNAVAERLRGEPRAFPVLFRDDSCTVGGEGYAHARTAVIVAGPNPRNARFSLVFYAGLSSDSTREVVQQQPKDCEVMLFAHGRAPKALAVTGAAQASNASTGK